MVEPAASIRLQKVMAQAGLGSRRQCEAMIEQGRVTVNGVRAKLGAKVSPSLDEIRVDGELLIGPEAPVYIALNKPPGVLSSLRSQGGLPTVSDLVPIPERIYPVGRLDVHSQGLILLTNDGELANRLTHPRFGHEKEYLVELDRIPSLRQLAEWRAGVVLPDGHTTLPAQVTPEREREPRAWLRIVLKEGRKRQLREMAKALGLEVRTLIRVRIASLELGDLAPGQWRRLAVEEVSQLKQVAFESNLETLESGQ